MMLGSPTWAATCVLVIPSVTFAKLTGDELAAGVGVWVELVADVAGVLVGAEGEEAPLDDALPTREVVAVVESPGFVPAFPVSGFTFPFVDQLSFLVELGAERSCGAT